MGSCKSGGKISAGGGINKNTGFSFINQNGKTVTIQITSAGVILLNGSPNKLMTSQKYQAMYNAKKDKAGFKALSSTDLQKMSDARYKDYNSHDYELIETGKGRGKIYRPRKTKGSN